MKVGDVVRVKADGRISAIKAGMTGVIANITEFDLPYNVQMDNGSEFNFHEEELELVEDKLIIQTRDFVNYVVGEFANLICLFKEKNQQYRTGGDPLADFRTSAMMNQHTDDMEAMFKEAWQFASKHVVHVANHGITGNKVEESLGDIAVYCVIMKYMHKKYLEKK